MMKIIAMIRTHNSEWIIGRTIMGLNPIVDGIVIHDHNSTDKTVELCKQYEKVLDVFETKGGEYDEGRDKSILLNMAKKYNPDYLLIMDDDEVFPPGFSQRIRKLTETGRAWRFPLLYLWGSTTHVRVDGEWTNQWRSKLFPNMRETYFPTKKCHCSPHGIVEEYGQHIPIIHYGYCTEELIKTKFDLYKELGEEVNQMSDKQLEEQFNSTPHLEKIEIVLKQFMRER